MILVLQIMTIPSSIFFSIAREPLGSSVMRLKNIVLGVVFIAYQGKQSLVVCFYGIKHIKQTKQTEHFSVSHHGISMLPW